MQLSQISIIKVPGLNGIHHFINLIHLMSGFMFGEAKDIGIYITVKRNKGKKLTGK
jgi:hypothetical protein